MSFITRAEWGARPPSGGRNSINAVPLGTAVHWNGPGCAARIRDHSQCAGFVRGIQNFHMDGRGWSDIAYTDFACPHGDLFEGRGKGVGTAANGTDYGNSNYYAVYLMWGEGDGPIPAPMLEAARDAIALHRSWGAKGEITKHRALFRTECPGDEVSGRVDAGHFEPKRGGGAQDVDFDKPKPKPQSGGFKPLWKIPKGLMSVEQVQRAVGVKPVDGLYGQDTKAAVERYQRLLGVAADGKWGKDTQAAHKRKGRKSRGVRGLLQRGSRGSAVRRLQRGLNKGFPLYSSLSVDGIYGRGTEKVVKEFQRRSGLAPDGIVGPVTRKHLRRSGVRV